METITKTNKKNGEILLGFRKQNSWTQEKLAEVIGRGKRDISKYEKGYRAIPQNAVDYLNSTYNLKLKATNKVVNSKVDYYTPDTKVERVSNPTKTAKEVSAKITSPIETSKTSKIKKASKTSKTSSKSNTKITVDAMGSVEITTTTPFRAKGSTFAKRMVSFRTYLNLSVADFAKKFKFDVAQYKKIENGKSEMISTQSLKAFKKDGWDIYDFIR